jgi:hypothetical protein
MKDGGVCSQRSRDKGLDMIWLGQRQLHLTQQYDIRLRRYYVYAPSLLTLHDILQGLMKDGGVCCQRSRDKGLDMASHTGGQRQLHLTQQYDITVRRYYLYRPSLLTLHDILQGLMKDGGVCCQRSRDKGLDMASHTGGQRQLHLTQQYDIRLRRYYLYTPSLLALHVILQGLMKDGGVCCERSRDKGLEIAHNIQSVNYTYAIIETSVSVGTAFISRQ